MSTTYLEVGNVSNGVKECQAADTFSPDSPVVFLFRDDKECVPQFVSRWCKIRTYDLRMLE